MMIRRTIKKKQKIKRMQRIAKIKRETRKRGVAQKLGTWWEEKQGRQWCCTPSEMRKTHMEERG